MEVVFPSSLQRMDFEFNNAARSSFFSAPSSPRSFGNCCFSAPTSPTKISAFYRDFNIFSQMDHCQSSRRSKTLSIPFDWEEKPGTPKSLKSGEEEDVGFDFDFAFVVSNELDKPSLSAEELFDSGQIRPLKPPPRLQIEEQSSPRGPLLSPRSPKSPFSRGKNIIREVFSPRKKREQDPFEMAIEKVRNKAEQDRGRDMSKNPSRRAVRSLSPFRVLAYRWEEKEKQLQVQQNTKQSSMASTATSSSSKISSRKWRLTDFLLFRSALDGKDSLRKYSGLFRRSEKVKDDSTRSDSGSGSGRRRRVSSHEMLYATSKETAEDLKKRTFFPRKQGILGRFAFNPTVHVFTRS